MSRNPPESRLDNLFGRLLARPTTANSLMAIEAPGRGLSWRGVAPHLRADSGYCIASCTKLYTGVLVRQFIDEGGFDLDDRVVEYLPAGAMDGLHTWRGEDLGPTITVRHLISNTSGLPDYFEERPRGGTSFRDDIVAGRDPEWDTDAALQRTRELRPLFAPGTPGRAYYSDTNFQLLGQVLEYVGGRPFAQLVEERIAAALGLRGTWVFGPETDGRYDDVVPISAGRAQLRLPRTFASLGAQGGVISTLDDSIQFLRAYVSGALFRPSWLDRKEHWNPIFFPFRYGLGTMTLAMHPVFTMFRRVPPLFGHSGSSGIVMFHCPELDVFICGGTNQLKARGAPYRFMLQAIAALG